MNDTHDPRTIGRVAAALLLAQMIAAPVVNFRLLAPAISAEPGFLVNAAAHAAAVNAAVLLSFAGALCSVGFALAVSGVLARHARAIAMGYLVLAGVGLVLTCAEGSALRAMVAVSQAYQQAAAGDAAALYEPSRAALRGLRNTLHYLHLLESGVALLLLYTALGRFRLIPRWLGALGALTSACVIAGAVVPLLGRPTLMQLFMPMGISQLLLIGWLLWRGFATPMERREVFA
ncbi:MAG TPA: DUF4386 family protein [Steroidobacteraceae bacterium]|nr:DUF4386 family protein [Steroidobacteraceae bacterium]